MCLLVLVLGHYRYITGHPNTRTGQVYVITPLVGVVASRLITAPCQGTMSGHHVRAPCQGTMSGHHVRAPWHHTSSLHQCSAPCQGTMARGPAITRSGLAKAPTRLESPWRGP